MDNVQHKSSVGALIPLGPNESAQALKPSQGFVSLWLLLTFVWTAISSSFAIESLATGALISAALAFVLSQKFGIWSGLRFSPSRVYHYISYLRVLFVELVRANLNIMRYVWARRLDVDPGIVKVSTRLKSPIGRLALANSISLTPGSLVLDVNEDELVIHCIDMRAVDRENATEAIVGPFEAHLEGTFG